MRAVRKKKQTTNWDGTGRPCEEVKLWHLHMFTRRQSLCPRKNWQLHRDEVTRWQCTEREPDVKTKHRFPGVKLWLNVEGGLFCCLFLMKRKILTCKHRLTDYILLKLQKRVVGIIIKVPCCVITNKLFIESNILKFIAIMYLKKTFEILFWVKNTNLHQYSCFFLIVRK